MESKIPKIDYKIISNYLDPSFNDEIKKFNYAISHYGFLLLKNTPIDKKVKTNILKAYKSFSTFLLNRKTK